ncbi:MAG: bifunctional pyr operon transcriptional regulator/uracil phosphoribosyltransferase PyrR [Bacteroidetes bacterium]|nr:bifunctional pyr operon transcriptional regulator/uracil phosphoribosyltransferase PyrR [Bacteroidota bacterium]MBK9670977.1 bifunctional pyr operon transcriptional regulator/uracil phosphoribosyltransferase PyrR [Bacteroidota bacterium]MBK9798319.1 bifunctional pyr operon transcriptional regulator/uracil phosphoribosyltransferase PyrR [Bacteroidota bacterium]MBP6414306.1 bifunctional pyr operon transcriptional regulator/uracil phosphoribosyltransferase PyrR [Bacteroidia bacterium]
MLERIILSPQNFKLTLNRLCYQLIENYNNFENTVMIGLQPRGTFLAQRIHEQLISEMGKTNLLLGSLDVTFYRDDFRKHDAPLIPQATDIDFTIEDKKVILVDDVLFTGRTIRSGLDAMLSFGRPQKVELMVLIDRRFSRDLPIEPNYVGKTVDTIASEKVKVMWKQSDGEDLVKLITT